MRTLSTLGLAAGLLSAVLASSGSAQEAAVAPATEKAPIATPPHIPPPPPIAGAPSSPSGNPQPPPPPNLRRVRGYGRYPAYPAYPGYPSPPPHGVYRPISLTLAIGPGALFGYSANGARETDPALSYNLFRLAFGIAPNLSLFVGFEGAGASSKDITTNTSAWLSQQIWSFGLQFHFLQRFYLRGGIGLASLQEETDFGTFSPRTHGTSYLAGVGFELVQTRDVALGLEATGSATRYAGSEWWQAAALNLTLAFF